MACQYAGRTAYSVLRKDSGLTQYASGRSLPAERNTQYALPYLQSLITSTTTISYTYDPLYRLTGAVYSSSDPTFQPSTFQYTYDAAGNRLQQVVDGVASNYTYDAADRLTYVDGVAYTYDDNPLTPFGDFAPSNRVGGFAATC